MRALLLAITVLTSSERPAQPNAAISASEAALLANRGDVSAATAQLKPLLAAETPHWSAIFVAACVAIEGGDLERASALAARLQATDTGRAGVLDRLIARRRARPAERMNEALAAAWKAAGKPDLSTHPLAHATEPPLPGLSSEILARLEPGVALVLDPSSDRTVMYERALAAAQHAASNPLYVNLEILAWLTFDKKRSPEDATRRSAAVQEVARAAANADPQNGYMRLVAALAGPADDAPLSGSDVDALETALRQPRIVFPRARLHAELLRTTAVFDPEHAEYRAMFLLMGIAPSAPFALRRRADATNDKVLRVRAASVLVEAGKVLGASGVLLDHMLGLTLTRDAARMSGDPVALALAKRAVEDEEARLSAQDAASKRLGFWPLASLWRERMPDFSRERADLELRIDGM